MTFLLVICSSHSTHTLFFSFSRCPSKCEFLYMIWPSFPFFYSFSLSGPFLNPLFLLISNNLLVGGWLCFTSIWVFQRNYSKCSWKLIWTMMWVRLRRMHPVVMGIVRKVVVFVVCPLQHPHLLLALLQLMCLLLIWSFGMLVLALSPHCLRKEMWWSTSRKVT